MDILLNRVGASYGVLCRQLYNPKIHFGAMVEFDSFNKKQRWALNQIDWLIQIVSELSSEIKKSYPV